LLARILVVLTGLFLASACQPKPLTLDKVQELADAASERATRDRLQKEVELAFQTKDFTLLSAMEHEFLTSRTRTGSGVWELGAFHAGVQYLLKAGLDKNTGCQYTHQDFATNWAAAQPKNPAPIITQAYLLTEQAWCFRGNGRAPTVSADDWPKFYEGLEAANRLLDDNKEIAAVDPEFYTVKARIYRGLNASPEQFDELLKEATKREPNYHRTYFDAVLFYMPQWGGSYEQVHQFAQFAARQSRETEGTALYARLFFSMMDCNCDALQNAAQWPELQQSMRDTYLQYPVGWNREAFTKMACKMNNLEEAMAYTKIINPTLDSRELYLRTTRTCAQTVAVR
jgi:hypothetical protein